jgi:hypothetical protein
LSVRVEVVDYRIRRGEKRNCASLTAAGAGPGERDSRTRRVERKEREGTEDLRLGRDECTRDDVTLWDDTSCRFGFDARSNVMMMAWSVG